MGGGVEVGAVNGRAEDNGFTGEWASTGGSWYSLASLGNGQSRVGDEADCAALTPPGFYLKSLPRQSGTGGGLAVLHRTSLTRHIAVSAQDSVFTAFEICEVRLSYDGHTAVFLSVYRPLPSRQNKLTNTMFLEQFSDLLESCFL